MRTVARPQQGRRQRRVACPQQGRRRLVMGVVVAVMAVLPSAWSPPTAVASATGCIASHPVNRNPEGITAGPDSAVWFAETNTAGLGRLPLAAPGAGPEEIAVPGAALDITTGADANLWFTEPARDRIGRIGPVTRDVTELPAGGLSAGASPHGITAGPDGNLWFTEKGSDKVARLTTAGDLTEFALPAGAAPTAITTGPDARLWLVESGRNAVARVDPTDPTAPGGLLEVAVPTAASQPGAIAAGPGGSVWVTESATNKVARIDTAMPSTVVEVTLPGAGTRPAGITAGPDANMWVTASAPDFAGPHNRVLRITPSGTISEFPDPFASGNLGDITLGTDAGLWFAQGSPVTGFARMGRLAVAAGPVLDFDTSPPCSSATPPALEFPTTAVGATSFAQTLRVQSNGTAAVVIDALAFTGSHPGDFVIRGGSCAPDLSLAPGESCTVRLSFAPTAPGARTANLAVTDRVTGVTIEQPLNGTGQEFVAFSPDPLDFGADVQVGTTTAARTLTLTARADVSVQEVAVVSTTGTDTPGDFAVVTDACTGANLSSGDTCEVSITFSPAQAGTRTAALSFTDTAPGSPHRVRMSGVAVPPPAPALSVSRLDFSGQKVGSTSALRTVTLSNSGSSFTISEVALVAGSAAGASAADFTLTTTDSDSCTAGKVVSTVTPCKLFVRFRPSAAGARSAAVNISHDAAGSPLTLPLSGTGTVPRVRIEPTALDLGTQAVGTTGAGRSFTVTNTGDANLVVAGVARPLGGPHPGDFTVSDLCAGASVGPQASCTVTVRFVPTATGDRSAVLSLSSDAAGSPHTVTVSGTGTPAPASPPPAATTTSTGGSTTVAVPRRNGYRLAAGDGGVFAFGESRFLGSAAGLKLTRPIVGMATTPSGNGYWLVAADGGIFAFGDARFSGSTGALRLTQPIVGMASTPSGNGYWLVAADGGIFAFGDAGFFGSTGAVRLTRPVVGMASTPSGNGYWLAAADGGIFSFGDARFSGSTGALRLTRPIVGMAATAGGDGYWLVAADGGIFSFGDARFSGSTGALRLPAPVIGMARSPGGAGYWLASSDGGIFAFGDARFNGSTGAFTLRSPIAGLAGG